MKRKAKQTRAGKEMVRLRRELKRIIRRDDRRAARKAAKEAEGG